MKHRTGPNGVGQVRSIGVHGDGRRRQNPAGFPHDPYLVAAVGCHDPVFPVPVPYDAAVTAVLDGRIRIPPNRFAAAVDHLDRSRFRLERAESHPCRILDAVAVGRNVFFTQQQYGSIKAVDGPRNIDRLMRRPRGMMNADVVRRKRTGRSHRTGRRHDGDEAGYQRQRPANAWICREKIRFFHRK